MTEFKQAGATADDEKASREAEVIPVEGDSGSAQDSKEGIEELAAQNAKLRDLLDARDEAEQKLINLQSTALDLQSRLRELEREVSDERSADRP